jgi:LuxR family transcriptional activator of conjugal transfer of Ti plasmids
MSDSTDVGRKSSDVALAHDLTPREFQCLLWCARGKTYAETALITGVAFGTVKSNLDHVRYKLNVATLPQATALAVAIGLLTPEDLKGR